MAEISKITLPDGKTYDIKDATARNAPFGSPVEIVFANGDSIRNTSSSADKGTLMMFPSYDAGPHVSFRHSDATEWASGIVMSTGSGSGKKDFVLGSDGRIHAIGAKGFGIVGSLSTDYTYQTGFNCFSVWNPDNHAIANDGCWAYYWGNLMVMSIAVRFNFNTATWSGYRIGRVRCPQGGFAGYGTANGDSMSHAPFYTLSDDGWIWINARSESISSSKVVYATIVSINERSWMEWGIS